MISVVAIIVTVDSIVDTVGVDEVAGVGGMAISVRVVVSGSTGPGATDESTIIVEVWNTDELVGRVFGCLVVVVVGVDDGASPEELASSVVGKCVLLARVEDAVAGVLCSIVVGLSVVTELVEEVVVDTMMVVVAVVDECCSCVVSIPIPLSALCSV